MTDEPFDIPETRIINGSIYRTGVAGTTRIYCHELSDKERAMELKPGDRLRPRFEVRMGFALFGNYNERRRSDNPFHPHFDDNYATGRGNTEQETCESLAKEISSTADSLWAF